MGPPEVTIEQGKLRGSTGTNLRGETFLKFQGIPYAKPPLGELRFKSPQPPEKWTGVFDASKEGDVCYCRDLFRPEIISGSENCLVLNVYTKTIPDEKKKNLRPVLFWIHGGGFVFGSGTEELYAPDYLITEDVVVVTINYRLGILGFLRLEDPSLGVPGNAGMKDMVMALKWVQKNIDKFGGDPNNVTIFGESAGGASIHLLLLSPMSKGLFHKAIAQSGCAVNPWAQGTPGAKRIAKDLNLESSDEKSVLKFLMDKSVEELYEIQNQTKDNMVASEIRPFGVVVEKNSKEPAFLPEEPMKLLAEKKFQQVPFMIGFTTNEGIAFEVFKNPEKPEGPALEDLIPWYLGYKVGTDESKALAAKIKKFYFGEEEEWQKNIAKKYDLLSDVMFLYGIYVTVMNQFHASKAPTYVYQVSIETQLNFFKEFAKVTVPGVSHCDDVGYLFKHFLSIKIEPGSIEEKSVTRFVKLWTNFAKYGNPTPDKNDSVLDVVWKPVTRKELDYLDIGEKLTMRTNPFSERINFWKEIYVNSPAAKKSECTYLKSV
jgi:carboxylesterase type B